MGTYLNPGKAAFEEAVNSEIFVDKTERILYLKLVRQPFLIGCGPREAGGLSCQRLAAVVE